MSAPQCTSQLMLHADNVSVRVNHRCLFLPHSGLLQTSCGSPPPPVSLPGASAAQVTQGGMTSTPHIHQTVKSSRREQTELNLGVIIHYKPTAESYASIWWPTYIFIEIWHDHLFSSCTVCVRLLPVFMYYSQYFYLPVGPLLLLAHIRFISIC